MQNVPVTPKHTLKYLLKGDLKYNCLALSLNATNQGKIEFWSAKDCGSVCLCAGVGTEDRGVHRGAAV